jgi:hypothetical protein
MWIRHFDIIFRRKLNILTLFGYYELDTFITSNLEESIITALITIFRF